MTLIDKEASILSEHLSSAYLSLEWLRRIADGFEGAESVVSLTDAAMLALYDIHGEIRDLLRASQKVKTSK